MSIETFPAKFCRGDTTKVDDMPVGGYMRREKNGYAVWWFVLPDGRRSKPIPEALVQHYDEQVGVDLGGWSLRKGIWKRST
jgi:hypothetical protein